FAPEGKPLTPSPTLPVNPFFAATAAVLLVLLPTTTVRELGVAEIVKSAGAAAGMISIPRRLGLVWGAPFVPRVKAIVIVPLLSAAAVNCSTTALNSAPAAAKISKFDSTVVPLMATLKARWPAA